VGNEPLPYSRVVAQLGPILFGAEWIGDLNYKERWLVENYEKRPSNNSAWIIPAQITYGSSFNSRYSPLKDPEYVAALKKHDIRESQLREIRDWLDDHGVTVIQGDPTDFVDKVEFKRALAQFRRHIARLARAASINPATAKGGRSPTYPEPVTYSARKVPQEFTDWAEKQHAAGNTITADLAEKEMRGPKDANGNRSGGLLQPGQGLSRETIRGWVNKLPEDWHAHRGTPSSKSKRR
jgi:hypothetical protein